MKHAFLFFVLMMLAASFFGSGCKKVETTTVIIRDTDTVVVRDTLRVTRTDRYGGLTTLDCPGGCPVVYDSSSTVEATYYPNDSTGYRLITRGWNIPPRKDTFYFAIVTGKISGFEDQVDNIYQKGTDSLIFYGSERPNHGLGTIMFWFAGKKSK